MNVNEKIKYDENLNLKFKYSYRKVKFLRETLKQYYLMKEDPAYDGIDLDSPIRYLTEGLHNIEASKKGKISEFFSFLKYFFNF